MLYHSTLGVLALAAAAHASYDAVTTLSYDVCIPTTYQVTVTVTVDPVSGQKIGSSGPYPYGSKPEVAGGYVKSGDAGPLTSAVKHGYGGGAWSADVNAAASSKGYAYGHVTPNWAANLEPAVSSRTYDHGHGAYALGGQSKDLEAAPLTSSAKKGDGASSVPSRPFPTGGKGYHGHVDQDEEDCDDEEDVDDVYPSSKSYAHNNAAKTSSLSKSGYNGVQSSSNSYGNGYASTKGDESQSWSKEGGYSSSYSAEASLSSSSKFLASSAHHGSSSSSILSASLGDSSSTLSTTSSVVVSISSSAESSASTSSTSSIESTTSASSSSSIQSSSSISSAEPSSTISSFTSSEQSSSTISSATSSASAACIPEGGAGCLLTSQCCDSTATCQPDGFCRSPPPCVNIPTTNRLVNPGFESGSTEPWAIPGTNFNPALITAFPGFAAEGTYHLRVPLDQDGSVQLYVTQYPQLVAGATISCSAFVRDAGVGSTYTITISGVGSVTCGSRLFSTSGEWEEVSGTAVVPPGGGANQNFWQVAISIQTTGNADSIPPIDVDDVQFTYLTGPNNAPICPPAP